MSDLDDVRQVMKWFLVLWGTAIVMAVFFTAYCIYKLISI